MTTATVAALRAKTEAAEPLLAVKGLRKRFGAVQALADVNLVAPAGKVTALVGDNGAGKSVLIKCIAGIHEPDGGEIVWEGRLVRIRDPRDSSALGVEVVYQDLALCDNLDVVQNMFLGRERLSSGLLDEDDMERTAAETLASLRVATLRSIRQPVASLSGGQRQAIAVAKAVMWNSKLVILDEPTAALGVAQTKQVLELVRRLADHGLAVIMVSHNLNDVFAVADRIVVLRLGRTVAEGDAAGFDTRSVVELMTTGRSSRPIGAPAESGEAVEEAQSLRRTLPEDDVEKAAPAGSAIVADASGQSLDAYLRALWSRILAGQSGVLPVVLGVALIAIIFQVQNASFLTPGNLVNLLVQGAVFMLIGMGEIFVLLLGEIDLSLGFVAGIGATVATLLVEPNLAWPWWGAIGAALIATAVLGAVAGAADHPSQASFVRGHAGRPARLPGLDDRAPRRRRHDPDRQRYDQQSRQRDAEPDRRMGAHGGAPSSLTPY